MKRCRRPTGASSACRQQRGQGGGRISAGRVAKTLLIVVVASILSSFLENIFCSSSFPFFCLFEHGYIRNRFSNTRATSYDGHFAAAYYPSMMNIQSEALRQLLDVTYGNSGVALELVNLRAATTDLCAVVSVSDFRDRGVVCDTLRGVAADIQALGRRLTKTRVRVNGFADV